MENTKNKIAGGLGSRLLIIILLFSSSIYAQLNVFDLQVEKTDETCLGNGSLTFSTVNATPLASFLFTVYKLPNLNTPISVSASNNLGSLNAGTYKIVATQTLDAFTNSDEEQIVIESAIIPLAYSINVTNQNCSQGAQVTLAATSGTISECEIISGPQTRPLQTSTVFNDLPAGQYDIRAFDACGEAVVTTYTVILAAAPLSISDALYPNTANPDCDSILVNNIISAPVGSAISYPISIQYTIYPPDGGDSIVMEQNYTTGPADSLTVTQDFPFYESGYSYDIQIVDNCNITFSNNQVELDPSPNVVITEAPGECGKYIVLNVTNFTAPLTVELTGPPGFDPVALNGNHPGPFNEGIINYGGMTTPIIAGDYIVQITDACGRTANATRTIEEELLVPVAQGTSGGCSSSSGSFQVLIPGRPVVTAVITTAPQGYSQNTPEDVSQFIEEGKLYMIDLPIGTYVLTVTDNCGMVYENVEVVIPVFTDSDFIFAAVPYCTEGIGSVFIKSPNGHLTSMIITSAPSTFTEPIPFDASANIVSSGRFFMGDLPGGDYVFSATDACGVQRTMPIAVTGYTPDAEPFEFVPNCGSFDIVMSDTDTTSAETTYWMQKQHPLTGQWGHPANGSAYQSGVPTTSNSIALDNNETTYNIVYSGTFRIVKSFKSYASGTAEQYCIETWEPFTFNMDLDISDAYTLSCSGNPDNVYIEAVNGLAPYSYRITEKDGVDFIIDNGNDNVFTNLEPGIYNFEVTDSCQNISNKLININLLPSLVTANLPNDMLLCTESGTEINHIFDLSAQTPGVLGNQHPDNYTVTYHLSLEDADNNTNALPANYANISNPQTIYARIVHNFITICHDVISFDLQVNQNPVLEATNSYLCEGEPVVLSAASGFDSYLWSTGETTQSIIVDAEGTYSITVKQVIGDSYCENTYDVNVAASGAATIVGIETEDWTYDQNSISVNTSGQGTYEYSLDGVNYQDSPVFNGLLIGNYTVYVRDKNGCGITKQDVLLLNYPNFFTPNGDGTHDTWRIKYSYMEPNMEIDILDRYGKLIISLNPQSEGWDGTYNGSRLPSTDYWFVVKRENGQVHKGHFAMKR